MKYEITFKDIAVTLATSSLFAIPALMKVNIPAQAMEVEKQPEIITFAIDKTEREGIEKTILDEIDITIVDMSKIFLIESNNNPLAVNKSGARGLGQVMEGTWNECVKAMGKDWDYHTDWEDPVKNAAVSAYYMNTKIPKMLKYYEIPDIIDPRLAAYNWGIGHLKSCYKEYNTERVNHIPIETKGYIRKYWR